RLIDTISVPSLSAYHGYYDVTAREHVPQMGQRRSAVKHIQRQWLSAEVGKHASLSRKRFEAAEKNLDLFPARLFDFGVGEGWRADTVRSKGLRDALPDHLLISHEVAGASCPLHLRGLLERAKLCRKRVIGSFGFTGRSMPTPRLHAGHRNFESRPRRNEDRGVEHPVLLEA